MTTMALAQGSAGRLGPYHLFDRLGVGGMAEVFVAERVGPHGFAKKVALKRILPGLAADPRFVAMFCDEARICAALSHPNIVQVLDFGEVEGELFMAMEFVDGLTVARLLRAAATRRVPVPLGAALYIAHEVLRGLEYAHEAIGEDGRSLRLVHRDVSPGNILIGRAGDVKLSDFGIVRSELVARRTQPGELKGKMGYMSPEQVTGVDVDARSDLFTVGIVLAELLLLRPLFSGKNELEILTKISRVDLEVLEKRGSGIPSSVRSLILGALKRNRQERFGNARAFADAIAAVARKEGIVLGAEQLSPWLLDAGFLAGSGPQRSGRSGVMGARRPRGRPSSGQFPAVTGPGADEHESAAEERGAGSRVNLRTVGGASLGTVAMTELMSLAATGRVPLDGLASVNGAPFTVISLVPGPAALGQRRAYHFGAAPAGRAEWTITSERRLLPGYLYRIVHRKLTGVLALRSGEQARRVFFEEGVPAFVSSTDPSSLLGRLLVDQGALTSSDLNDALIASAAQARRLGEVLVEAGRLRSSSLLRILEEQRLQRLSSIFGWSRGGLEFVPEERSGEMPPRPRLGGHAVVTQAVRQGYDSELIAQALAPFRDAAVVRTNLSIDPLLLGLTDSELRCVRAVSATRAHTLRSLIEATREERLARSREALFAVFIGVSAGVLSLAGWKPDVT